MRKSQMLIATAKSNKNQKQKNWAQQQIDDDYSHSFPFHSFARVDCQSA